MNEHDLVVLRTALPEHGLEEGDVGVAIAVGPFGPCEVEFMDATGGTIAVVSLDHASVRPMRGSEILHVRQVGAV